MTLPFLNSPLSPNAALDLLRTTGRGALILKDQEDYKLLDAASLGKAQASGVVGINQIEGRPVLLLDNSYAASFGVDLVRPRETVTKYTDMFKAVQKDFAIAGLTHDVAFVVTSSEEYTIDLGTGGYRCNGSPRHYFPWPKVAIGNDCPDSPDCDVDGRTSKIEAL